jgi:hypothetical protein
VGFEIVERDAAIGGGLLAGALAYRLFVLLLPTALPLVSGLGLYAGAVDKSPATVAQEAGLHGLIASEVASAASGRARAVVFLLMIPAVLYESGHFERCVPRFPTSGIDTTTVCLDNRGTMKTVTPGSLRTLFSAQ